MKALIAMSGGVDSSVAALLMKEKEYDCIGCTMKLYSNEDIGEKHGRTCCSLDDVEDARSVAARLGMKYYVFNMTEDFRSNVIDRFIDSYEKGITPNPCIDCNRYMKFDRLYDKARILDCEKIVTGHYARIQFENGEYHLLKAKDARKDQSYVLYTMTQEQLAHTEFPLGELCKDEVRKIAEKNNFVNAEKPDSQDICFVPDGDYAAAIRRMTGKDYPQGDFVDFKGNILGRHKGIICYTVGQRKGLGIPASESYYVCRIDAEQNQIVLGTYKETLINEIFVEKVNWIAGIPDNSPVKCKVKVRYRQPEQTAVVYLIGKETARVVFEKPQSRPAFGQSAVFYDGDVVLGGGINSETTLPPCYFI